VGACVTKVQPGDHVVLAPASDGICEQCGRGAPMYCERFNELNFQTGPDQRTAKLNDGGHAWLRYSNGCRHGHEWPKALSRLVNRDPRRRCGRPRRRPGRCGLRLRNNHHC
jgi:threonine dehydrogenase-like Zn-dependent dehydrogenase